MYKTFFLGVIKRKKDIPTRRNDEGFYAECSYSGSYLPGWGSNAF